MKEKTGQFIGQ